MNRKQKEIKNYNNGIDFNLVRKKPNSLELRAYLFKVLTDCFELSNNLRDIFVKEFHLPYDEVYKWNLDAISEPDIRRILKDQYLLPEEIFYFKKEYKPNVKSDWNYRTFPEMFTSVCNVSFDKGGLIVLQLYNSQIYLLYDANGNCLTDCCHDLQLGTDGKVLIRESDSCWWKLMKYNGKTLEFLDFNGSFDSPSDFPDIRGRDIIPEMFPVGTFNEHKYDQSKIMTNEEVKVALLNNCESYHYLQKFYQDNEELALIAVNSNLYAFTFLSERLQCNKDYIIKLITAKNENQWLYGYLNCKLKNDFEIVKLCIKYDYSIIRNIAPVTDRELMEEATKDCVYNLEYASEDIKSDKSFVLTLVRKNWRVLREVSKTLLSDSAFIAEAIYCFNVDHQKEKIDINEVVNFLVSWNPHALMHIAPTSDMKIICSCLQYTDKKDIAFIIDCISDDLKKTKAFWLTAVTKSLYMLKNAPLIYRQDKEVVISAIWYHGELVEFADESLGNDPDIFLAAIRQIVNRKGVCDPRKIMHLVPEKFKSDKNFLLKVIEDYPKIFELVPLDIRSDREFMLKIIEKTYGWIIQYIAPELQSNNYFIVDAAKVNNDILRWLPDNIRHEKEIIEMLSKEGIDIKSFNRYSFS